MALERGISPDMFWESSVLEVIDMMQVYDHIRQVERKEKIQTQFILANAISTRIGFIFGDEKKRRESDVLQPWDVAPDLFEDQTKEIEQRRSEVELAKYKAGFAAYAARWNERNNV